MEEKLFLESDRIPAFIGKGGLQKREFEKKFDCEINVDSKTGELIVECEDALNMFVFTNVVTAINFGHSPMAALKLEDETFVLDTIDVKTIIKDHVRLKSVMGRIIGKEGSTRKVIEEITKCSVSVRDHFVSFIGPYENTILVHEALEMLIKGASHKTLYGFLERNKHQVNTGLL